MDHGKVFVFCAAVICCLVCWAKCVADCQQSSCPQGGEPRWTRDTGCICVLPTGRK